MLAVLTDVEWAPKPNRLISAREAPADVPVTGSHVFVVCDRSVLLVDVIGRGWSPPGGRTEPGETAEQTARREAWEEAGLTDLQLFFLGVWRLTVLGRVPSDYPYPAPESMQMVFATRLPTRSAHAPVLTDEVGSTRWFARDEIDALPGSAQWLPLLDSLLDGPTATGPH